MLVSEAIVEFKLSRDWTPRSATYYDQRLSRFADWCEAQGVRQLGDITTGVVRRYFLHLRERPSETTGKPLKSKTAHGHSQVVKTLLRFCYLEELTTADVMRRVQMPVVTQEVIPTFSPDEVRALLKACATPRDAALVALLVDSGLRAAECCALELEDVHLTAGDAYLTVRMGKGRKWREVGMGRKAALLLARYLHAHRPATAHPQVFIGKRGPLTPSGLHKLLLRTGQRAGITDKRLSAHSYRHSSATLAAEAGMDVLRISHKLGHSRLATTQLYLRGLSSKAARSGPSVLDNI
jgi:site-specific recombinase XerD